MVAEAPLRVAAGAPATPGRVAVVGAGWAGLAAAVSLAAAGCGVTLIEAASRPGGRARTIEAAGRRLDNGQHILIGAYTETLALMRQVGVDADAVLLRQPLALRDAAGRGLALPAGPAAAAFVRGVWRCAGWSVGERLALLRAALGWRWADFRCDAALSVEQLCRGLPTRVLRDFVEPLTVAALNTRCEHASAEVWLCVLRDALFGGPGAADLLLPRRPLDDLLPGPALAWLARSGAELRCRRRVGRLAAAGPRWSVDDEDFDAVILACGPGEAARLAAPLAPTWAASGAALEHEPIVTVVVESAGARLAQAMTALAADDEQSPAQFAFDHGALGGAQGRIAFVVSAAARWLERGRDAIAEATLRQARTAFPPGTWPVPPAVVHVMAERRATFRCTPGLQRPGMAIAPRLLAAGDHVAGPYPASLEAAVRAGRAAARALLG